jgi:cell division protein FtsW (lipid II flippase)
MSYKVLFVLNALIALVCGLGFLFVPAMAVDLFGTEKYAATLFVARLFGMAVFAIGLLLWFARNITDANFQKQLGWTMFVSALIGLVIMIIGVSPASGVIRVNAWIPIVFFAFSCLGYAFMLFLKPRMKE